MNDQEIAIIANPINGFNDTAHFTPGNTCQVKRWSDDAVVYSGNKTAWNSGVVHAQSGDIVWWFNFSALKTAGYDVNAITQKEYMAIV